MIIAKKEWNMMVMKYPVSKLIYEHISSHLIKDRVRTGNKYDLVPGDGTRITVEANGHVVIEKFGRRIVHTYRAEQYISGFRARKLLFQIWQCVNSKKAEHITIYDTCSRQFTLIFFDGTERTFQHVYGFHDHYSSMIMQDFLCDLNRKAEFSELFENYEVRA